MEEVVSSHSIYVDTQVCPVDSKGCSKLIFVEKQLVRNIFFRQIIVRSDDIPLDNKYLVARFSSVKRFNNSLLYNTSLIDPDTDIVLDKGHAFGSCQVYEGRYMLPIQTVDKVFDSMSLQILDDRGAPFRGEFFADIKLSTSALK